MNRIIRSRVSGIAVLLIVSMAIVGCANCDLCAGYCVYTFVPVCIIPPFTIFCIVGCMQALCPHCIGTGAYQDCAEDPDECASSFEQLQTTAIEFCEEYPEECQQYMDAWLEASDTEAEE
jgi:hypothetical protein